MVANDKNLFYILVKNPKIEKSSILNQHDNCKFILEI